MIAQETIDRLKGLPVEQVAGEVGLEVVRHRCRCPFHDDRHPSLTFSLPKNRFKCYACGASGSPIDLAMHQLNLSFVEACRWLGSRFGIYVDEEQRSGRWRQVKPIPVRRPAPMTETEQGPSAADLRRWAEQVAHPVLSEAARRFLFEARRLDERVVRWCRLSSCCDQRSIHWLLIPYFGVDGQLIGMQWRNLDYRKEEPSLTPTAGSLDERLRKPQAASDSERLRKPQAGSLDERLRKPQASSGDKRQAPRFRFPKGQRCPIYGLQILPMLKPSEPLFVCEGASDCWSMLSDGHKAIAIPSATLLKEEDLSLLQGVNLHMYPDQDLPGERLFLQLRERLPQIVRHQLPEGCKDYSDKYVLMSNVKCHMSNE